MLNSQVYGHTCGSRASFRSWKLNGHVPYQGFRKIVTCSVRAYALSALALPAVAAVPFAARAAESAPLAIAQNVPFTATPPDAGRPEASPGNSGSPLHLSPSSTETTPNNVTPQAPSSPISNVPRVGLFPRLGAILLDHGIDLHGVAFDRFLTNPTAGIRTHEYENLFAGAPTVDVDLGKAIGLSGGNIHVSLAIFALRANQPNYITDAGGFLTGFQATPSLPGKAVNLSELTYEQRALNDHLAVEFGKTSVFRYFFLPNSLDPLTYYSSTIVQDGDFPSVPFPTWGGRATYKLSPYWYTQFGAFEDNFRRATNFPEAFGTHLSSGAQFLDEVGYRSDFSNSAYPANLETGFEWNTRYGYSNIKGSPAPASRRLTGADYPGGGIIYMQGLQTLWRASSRGHVPPANLAVYGSFNVAVDKPQPVDLDAIVGLNFTGFIPGRAFDALGVQAHYQRLSEIEANFESAAHNRFAGPGPNQNRDALAFEVVGNIQATNSIAFRPLVEYFVNPDNLGNVSLKRRPSDGVEVGLFTVVSLGRLLGTSTKPY